MGVTYDAGALIAAERGERRMWARHGALLANRTVPTVPAAVVAQTWRGGSRQALLSRLLVGCDVEALDDDQARRVGSVAAKAATKDIVDASVVEGALRRVDLVISSDPSDLKAIARATGRSLSVVEP
ncbi:MAG: twitching motility protein PilT [Actinobacteria bacterium]|nr:twitching motility protein PilT [Actinomycetota bacterium]